MTGERPALRPPAWEFYRNGKIVTITEDEARHQFDVWSVMSDDRGMALLLFEQLWAEIDRLRASARVIDPENEAMVECVARAICREEFAPSDEVLYWGPKHLDQMVDDNWSSNYAGMVRAILSALKEMP